MLILTEAWRERIRKLPETGMTYTVCTIVLKDGRTFPQAIIVGYNIWRIRGVVGVPFTEDEIAKIEWTHDKWDWNAE